MSINGYVPGFSVADEAMILARRDEDTSGLGEKMNGLLDHLADLHDLGRRNYRREMNRRKKGKGIPGETEAMLYHRLSEPTRKAVDELRVRMAKVMGVDITTGESK